MSRGSGRRPAKISRAARTSTANPTPYGPASSANPAAAANRPVGPTSSGPKMAPTVLPSTTLEMARPRSAGRWTSAAAKRPRSTADLAIPTRRRPIRKKRKERSTTAAMAIADPITPMTCPKARPRRRPIRSMLKPQTTAPHACPST